jgi:hypothetical protein
MLELRVLVTLVTADMSFRMFGLACVGGVVSGGCLEAASCFGVYFHYREMREILCQGIGWFILFHLMELRVELIFFGLDRLAEVGSGSV